MSDDQTIVAHVADKGAMVLTGCTHAGILSTVGYAERISGDALVYAVLGGIRFARQRIGYRAKGLGDVPSVPAMDCPVTWHGPAGNPAMCERDAERVR